jgi:hypothetical protein
MMSHPELEVEFFAALLQADETLAAAVAAEGCPSCGGPLHVANYERKPRGGLLAIGGEGFTLRHSLCCGKRGCRRRALPPSLRFLGRRVYLEVVVVLASVVAQGVAAIKAASEETGVPARTLKRWRCWWQQVLPQLAWWAELRALLVAPAPDEAALPQSLLAHLRRSVGGAQLMWLAAKCLAPGTTSLCDATRFVRVAAGLAGFA